MTYLFKLDDNFSNNLPHGSLTIISILSVVSGILVVISRNPIVSVLFLIGLFFSVASYLITLGLSFIGLSYLLVYVGAVSILFLFILMLINVRVSELITDNNNSIPLSIIILTVFTIAFNNKISSTSLIYLPLNKATYTSTYSSLFYNYSNNSDNTISLVTSYAWDGMLSESSHITSIGNILYTTYPMLLLITSIILLLAMVGAIIITVKK